MQSHESSDNRSTSTVNVNPPPSASANPAQATSRSNSAFAHEYSEAMEAIWQSTEITVVELRTMYDEMLTHVDERMDGIGDVALDELFDRARTDFYRLCEGRLAEISDAMDRLRRAVTRMEVRLERLEARPQNMIAAENRLYVTTDRGEIHCFADRLCYKKI